jgi:serine/threonine-protein kinase
MPDRCAISGLVSPAVSLAYDAVPQSAFGAMEITYAQLSSPGPVREINEDSLGFWQSDIAEDRRTRGAIAIIADGVGGHGGGEIASRLAVDAALHYFQQASAETNPAQALSSMFNQANIAVYDAAMKDRDGGKRMATTLTISLFRNDTVTIGHVGDCRVYLVQHGRIRRLTDDHSYSGVQVKLGLITVDEAANSELRSVLTRSVGLDPFIRADYHTLPVHRGDILIQCCDGLYCSMSEREIFDIVTTQPPEEACRQLIALAERRAAADNLSVQIVRVEDVETLSYYRGLPVYQKVPDIMSYDLQVGQLLDDRYQLEDIISRSGMATIFKATDLTSNRIVAIKVPFMKFESDPAFFSRFKREQEIGNRLNHPYILHFEPTDPEKRSRPYIVMEYLEGQTLGQLMRAVRPLPISDALRIAGRICEALHYMHDHDVIHRDLKPDNVMICSDGSIRVMDFGIAKLATSRRLTFGGFQPAMGTPDYMAPEQVKGKRGDARTDIYSLGAMLYEMVTGNPPYEGANPLLIMNARLYGDPIAPRVHNPEISPQVEEIILHAMERIPANRYSKALDMKSDLSKPESVVVTGRASHLQAGAPWKGRWRRARLLILGVGLPAVIVLVVFLLRHLRISLK